jgi:hypothetical protein
MRRQRADRGFGAVLIAILAGLILMAAAGTALAQARTAGTAEIRRLAGRVEVLRKGQTQWVPAVVGMKLGEGDDIRAYDAAAAELLTIDGSTLVLSENSRLFVTRLEYDAQNQTRNALLHLAVGKVRAIVSQAAITLVRARQSNFAITTPTAVAAARGTDFVAMFDEVRQQMQVAVLVEDPPKPSIVSCTSVRERFTTTLVRPGLSSTGTLQGCTPPVPIVSVADLSSTRNPMLRGPGFFGPMNPVSPTDLPNLSSGLQFGGGTTDSGTTNVDSKGRDNSVTTH